MEQYCVNRQAQANGDHEVHRKGCSYWPLPQNALDLGFHSNCHSAVTAARLSFRQVNGCFYCSRACHTG